MAVYIAYHGTDAKNVTSIKKNGFKPSNSLTEWLGSGVYFFIEGISCPVSNSREWAKNSAWNNYLKANTYNEYTVLKANVSGDNILDLRKQDDLLVFNRLREYLLTKFNKEVKKNPQLHPDTFLCNAISKSLKLDILINNLYIKNKQQRIKQTASRIPNTTVLCAKKNAKINKDSIEVFDTGVF